MDTLILADFQFGRRVVAVHNTMLYPIVNSTISNVATLCEAENRELHSVPSLFHPPSIEPSSHRGHPQQLDLTTASSIIVENSLRFATIVTENVSHKSA